MPEPSSSRRRFLAGSIGATSLLLSGCIGDDSSSSDDSGSNGSDVTAADVFLGSTDGPDRAVGGDEAEGVFATTIPSASEFDRVCSLDDYMDDASARITAFVDETDFEAESLLFASRRVPDASYEFLIASTFVAGNAAVLRTETTDGSNDDSRGETPAAEVADSLLVRVDPSVDGVETIAVVHDGESYEPSPSDSFDAN